MLLLLACVWQVAEDAFIRTRMEIVDQGVVLEAVPRVFMPWVLKCGPVVCATVHPIEYIRGRPTG